METDQSKQQFLSLFDLDEFIKDFKAISVKEGEKHLDLPGSLEDDPEQDDLSEEEEDNNNPHNHLQTTSPPPPNPTTPDNSLPIPEDKETYTSLTAPGVIFTNYEELATHYKSDWHRWNLKQRAVGLPLSTKQQFEQLKSSGEIPDKPVPDDTLSNVTEKKPLQGSNRIKFITPDMKQVTLWKNVVTQNPLTRQTDLMAHVEGFRSLYQKKQWAIFMSSGGRFSGGIFDQKECTVHRNFARYIVRKKQGGSQSSKDSKSGVSAPKSAGATMRRYNEKRYREQILEVLTDWADHLAEVQLIFLYGPGVNWNYFYAGTKAFKKGDPRIRSVPFTVRKPTLMEVKRIHHILSTIHIAPYDPNEDQETSTQEEPITLPDPTEEQEQEQEQEPLSETNDTPHEDIMALLIANHDLLGLQELFAMDNPLCVTLDAELIKTPVYLAVEHNDPAILQYLLSLDTGDLDTPIPGWNHRTALHRAANDGKIDLVKMLLDAGANPAPRDIHGKTPYTLGNQQTRDFIRKYAGENSQKYDWTKLGISPLTQEIEEEKKQKIAEKKRRKKQNAKLKQQEKKIQEQQDLEKKKKEEEEEEVKKKVAATAIERTAKIANMTEREKRAMAAERRMGVASGKSERCQFCGKPLTMVPFERLEYKYCSVECVRKHMDQLDKEKVKKT